MVQRRRQHLDGAVRQHVLHDAEQTPRGSMLREDTAESGRSNACPASMPVLRRSTRPRSAPPAVRRS